MIMPNECFSMDTTKVIKSFNFNCELLIYMVGPIGRQLVYLGLTYSPFYNMRDNLAITAARDNEAINVKKQQAHTGFSSLSGQQF